MQHSSKGIITVADDFRIFGNADSHCVGFNGIVNDRLPPHTKTNMQIWEAGFDSFQQQLIQTDFAAVVTEVQQVFSRTKVLQQFIRTVNRQGSAVRIPEVGHHVFQRDAVHRIKINDVADDCILHSGLKGVFRLICGGFNLVRKL